MVKLVGSIVVHKHEGWVMWVMWWRSMNPPICGSSLPATLRRSALVRVIELLGFACHYRGTSGVQH